MESVAKDRAIDALKEIEQGMTEAQWAYIRDPEAKWEYDNHRLYCQIIGLQKVVILNGGFTGFSKIPLLWVKTQ